jgi:3-oxoacyl-[acyl-carrier protein] reductase
VAPGIIAGRMTDSKFDADAIKRLVPMKRAGLPEEVASVVGFLASPMAAYVSGQIIGVDGAMT